MIIYIYTPSPLVHDSNLCVAHRVVSGGSRVELYDIIVGLSALLVSTNRAIPEPLERGTSNRRLHVSFLCRVYLSYTYRNTPCTDGAEVQQKNETR